MNSAPRGPVSWLRRWWSVALVITVAGLVLATLTMLWSIRVGVLRTADHAREMFGGDRVGALMIAVDSSLPMAKRNRAVWALGQLRDPRALPVLLRHYTGGPCDHARFLCQEELKKAIAACRGEDGQPAWFRAIFHAI